MKISCCVFDLDGTLLTSKNKISDIDKATLKSLSENGIKIVIATGRSYLQILEYADALGIADPVITCNGGEIITIITGETLYKKLLSKEDASNIITAGLMEGFDFLCYTSDCVFHSPSSERIKFFQKYNTTAPDCFKVPIRSITEYPKSENFSDIVKILIHGNVEKIPELNSRFNQNNTLTIVSSGKNLIDIMPENTSKGNGIKVLSQKLNIPLSEIVAFGDSMNDETMLKTAGFSVAMGNAEDYIKSICDYVTDTNDNCGITKALNYILNEL